MTFRLLCCSAAFGTLAGRQSGTSEMDYESATAPGIEELQDFAAYLGLRALQETTGLNQAKCSKIDPAVFVEAGLFIGAVDLVASRGMDLYDDEDLTAIISRLGIVGNPLDDADLWTDVAHTAPNITDPATKQGGVGDL